MELLYYPLAGIRSVLRKIVSFDNYTDLFVEYKGQLANDYLRSRIVEYNSNKINGLMVAKLGTYELENILLFTLKNKGWQSFVDIISGKRRICWADMKRVLPNTGFFPIKKDEAKKLAELYIDELKYIDILGSYQKSEVYINKYVQKSVKVDLEGYYAPFLFENPWTKELKGKKVLVVHPFVDSIKKQYEKREKLFENPMVLPEFSDLITIKAVQSIVGNKPDFVDSWFDALELMKEQISLKDFDIALIGCGAYGLPLAAHVKRMGKAAVHLAGWTQMLFGIYGNRWLNEQTKFRKFINEYWVRPEQDEIPKNSNKVENGCYW